MCPVRVLRSRTAMMPVNRELLPRSGVERERCGRTVYVAQIDERLDAADVRCFFSKFCGACTSASLQHVLQCVHAIAECMLRNSLQPICGA